MSGHRACESRDPADRRRPPPQGCHPKRSSRARRALGDRRAGGHRCLPHIPADRRPEALAERQDRLSPSTGDCHAGLGPYEEAPGDGRDWNGHSVPQGLIAALFLMPPEGVRGYVNALSKGLGSRTRAMAHHFGVSCTAMLYRLKGLDFVTEDERSSLAVQDSAGLAKAPQGIPWSSGAGRFRRRDAGPCPVRGDLWSERAISPEWRA